jgi:ferredoxin-thioredoxin reductase catalytic chain
LSSEYPQEVLDLYARLDEDAEFGGYHLNPDREFVLMLAEGLNTNQQRYGYMLCPCRMGEGEREKDLDIICPCDYRDADLEEYDQCY